jgi:tripartite-type tricarboxylate transporter receptor subunit TctC
MIKASLACAALITAAAGAVHAQSYPMKPIRLIIGFPPGGSNDIVARQLAPKLTQLLGAQVIVENRPGANATIATDFVAKAPPDGYTLMLGSASPLVISPFTYPNIPYDTLRDLAPITTVGSTPEMIAIHPSLPARNLKELVALAKAQPGKLNFASSGNGGLPHLAIELFGNLAKVKIVHVPYKGAGPAAVDLMGGHVHAMIS